MKGPLATRQSRADRQRFLTETWGFKCSCKACRASDSNSSLSTRQDYRCQSCGVSIDLSATSCFKCSDYVSGSAFQRVGHSFSSRVCLGVLSVLGGKCSFTGLFQSCLGGGKGRRPMETSARGRSSQGQNDSPQDMLRSAIQSVQPRDEFKIGKDIRCSS